MNSSFKLLLYIMKLNLKRINSFVVSILVTSCEKRQFKQIQEDFSFPVSSENKFIASLRILRRA